MPRAEKEARVKGLAERLSESQAAVLAGYRGLTVHEAAELRNALAEVGTRFSVVKNSLTRLAVKEAGLEGLEELIDGPTAIAFVVGDPVAGAKRLVEQARRFPVLEVRGGFAEGRILSADEIRALAALESREAMLATLAGLAKSQLARTAWALQALQSRFVGLMEALREKLPARLRSPRPLRNPRRPLRKPKSLPPTPRVPLPRRSRRRTVRTPTRMRPGRRKEARKVATKKQVSTDDLLEAFKGMTLLELSEFIKKFEEEFDVQSAVAAPVAAAGAGPPGAAADGGAEEEEQTEFDVILTSAGDKKIQVIKEVRALTTLGLKEAKDLVDGAPKPVLEKAPKDQAEQAKEKIEAAGGTVEVK